MTPENFCYWLQGVFEVSNPQELSKEQLEVIKEHLQLVFEKVTIYKLGEVPDKPVGNDEIQKLYDDVVCLNRIPKTHFVTGMKLCDSKEYPVDLKVEYGPQGSC